MTTTTSKKDERSRRRKGLLAVGAGVALLLGGGTYALWSASDSVDGGTITAGDFGLKAAAATFWDVSADRSDATDTVPGTEDVLGHAIDDLDTWQIVPGDTIAVAVPFKVTLSGDNLVAALEMTDADQWAAANGITFKYGIYGLEEGETVPSALVASTALPVAAGGGPLAYFQASEAGQAAGSADGTLPILDPNATSNLTVVIYATFDSTTSGTTYTKATTAMESIGLTLTQVREPGVGAFE